MRDCFALTFGNENQVDRLLDDGVRLQLYERAVSNERRVERGEGVVVERRDLAEMALGTPSAGANRLGETAHPNLLTQSGVRGQVFRELAVHEDERVPRGLAECETPEIGAGDHSGGASLR